MKRFFFIIVFLCSVACAPSRFVQPIEEGRLAVGVELGGPMIDYAGTPIPVPMSSVEVGYGLKENLTLFTGVHTTALAFGNVQLDGGCTYQFLKQQEYIPSLSVSPSVNWIWAPGEEKFNVWPILDINAFWNYGKRSNYIYCGFNNYFELSGTRSHDQDQQYPIVFSPQIGHVLKGKERSWEFVAEVKFIAPYAKNDDVFVPYNLTGHRGATGIYLGYRKYFNTKKAKPCTDCPTL